MDRNLRARQLIRFYSKSGSPFALVIHSVDLDRARRLEPEFDENNDDTILTEEQWPANWYSNSRSLPGFLMHWRRYELYVHDDYN